MLSKILTKNIAKRCFASSARRALPIKDASLKEHDPELYALIEKEKAR